MYSRAGERLGERLGERGDLVVDSSDIGFVRPTESGAMGALAAFPRVATGENSERALLELVGCSGMKRT